VSRSTASDDHSEARPGANPSVGRSIGLLFLLLVGTGVGDAVATATLRSSTTTTTRLLVTLCIAWPMVLIAAQLLQRAPLHETFQFRRAPLGSVLVSGLAGLSLGLLVLSLVTYIPTPAPQSATELHEAVSASNRVSLLLAMLVVGPLGEELFFRGWMLPVWVHRFGPARAIVGTTVLFSLLHILSWRVLLAIPIGLLLGWITVMSRSVVPAIIAHSASNSASSLIDPILRLSGLSSSDIAAMESVPWWLPTAALFAFCLSVAFLLTRATRRSVDQEGGS